MTKAEPLNIPHADHCGSLLRPRALREARRDHGLGTLGADALRAVEDGAILEVLELPAQRKAPGHDRGGAHLPRHLFHRELPAGCRGAIVAAASG